MPETDIVIIRIPALPNFIGTLDDADELAIWKASNDTTYHLTAGVLKAYIAGSGVQVPISFTATTGEQTYQGNTAGANYVAALAGLVAGAVIDQITVGSSILTPISDFVTQGVKTITFIAPTLATNDPVVIFWHLP